MERIAVLIESGALVVALTCLVLAFYRLRHLRRHNGTRDQRWRRMVDKKVGERTMQLEDEIEQYRAIVENLDAVAFELDVRNHQIVYIAPQAARLLECEPHELTLAHILASIHREDRPMFEAIVKRGFHHDGPIDCRMLTKKGRVIHTRTFVQVRAGSRRIRGLTLDVTREKQLETELRQAQKLESVGRLAAGIAHEINSPIQYIADSIDFVRGALDEVTSVIDAKAIANDTDLKFNVENMPLALDRAANGIERVARIIQSMKAFAHDKQEMRAVNVNKNIKDTLTIAANEYRYVAEVVTDLGNLPAVWAHAGDLQQVLLSLVTNAAHAIETSNDIGIARRGRITVTSRTSRGSVFITVADTGCGIDDEIRNRIFEPFFTTKDVGKGTGQGLAVAHSLIVERYHGSLTFESEVGKGSAFTIRLPAMENEGKVAA